MKRVVSVLFVLTAVTAVNTAVLGAAANRVSVNDTIIISGFKNTD